MADIPGFICITPDMQKFLDLSKQLVGGSYKVTELNEYYGISGGRIKMPLEEARERIRMQLGFDEMRILYKHGSRMGLEFFSEGNTGKMVRFSDIEIELANTNN